MILTSNNRGLELFVMKVVSVYQVTGALELDLLDSSGRIFESAQLLTFGGGPLEISAPPAIGAEVLAVVIGGASYVLGALNDQPLYQDEKTLNDAGEYIEKTAVGDTLLRAGEASITLSLNDAVYLRPRLRVQGLLEVSSGGAPALSAALAEPTLETLDHYQGVLNELKTAVEQLQQVASRLSSVYTASSATASAAGDLALAQDLLLQAQAAAQLPANTITAPQEPNRDIISNIVKIQE